MIANPNHFLFLRSHILNRQTAIEYQVVSRIEKAIDQNDTINDPLVQMQINTKSNPVRDLIIHYTHEARLGTYNCNSQVVLHVYNVQSSYQSISIFY